MVVGGIHKTKSYCRKRLKDPKQFDKRSFRTKTVSKRTKLIIACPRGEYDVRRKRCNVGTQTQAIIKRKLKSGLCPQF